MGNWQPVRTLEAKRAGTAIALLVAIFAVLVASISFSALASARVTPNGPSDSPTAYGGGSLFAADPLGGYWTVGWLGAITAHGGAPVFGSPALSGMRLSKPVVGMESTPDGHGYWLVASDGGVFAYGDAQFYGSTGALRLNEPIVGMAATPDGQGYWLVASDGGIFTFGDAQFYGSLGGGGTHVTGIIISPQTAGYALVDVDGTSTVFPTAPGSLGGLAAPATSTDEPPAGPTPADPPATPNASQGSDCQPATAPTVTQDSSLDTMIANESGPGWIGGDATYSTALPNGEEAFVFSDTVIGTAQPSGAATVTAFTHNSELVGSMPNLSGNFGGTSGSPQTLIPDTVDSGDQWQVGATEVVDGSQLVFVNEFAPVPGQELDRFTGHSGIAVLSLSAGGTPTYSSVVALPTDATTQWGNALMQDGGYSYIYGSDLNASANAFYGMKVARVAQGDALNGADWQYWNGTQWVSGEANAVPAVSITVLTGVAAQPNEPGFVAVSIPGWPGGDSSVDLSYSCSPVGPWSAPAAVYSIPQITQYQNEIAYIPTFHTELSTPGELVVSYNVNSTEGLSATEQDAHQYQPRFLQVETGS